MGASKDNWVRDPPTDTSESMLSPCCGIAHGVKRRRKVTYSVWGMLIHWTFVFKIWTISECNFNAYRCSMLLWDDNVCRCLFDVTHRICTDIAKRNVKSLGASLQLI